MNATKHPFIFKVLVIAGVLVLSFGVVRFLFPKDRIVRAKQASVLVLKLKGMLLDKDDFLKDLRTYAKDDQIKGILIDLDSPGGSVATSQAIYLAFKNIRERFKKPIVVSVGAVMASGALYAAAGADSIVVHSGSLVGSIGVIIPLVNMERLYDWAKIERYSIKTGEFKDIMSSYRRMTFNERVLFQDLTNDLLNQFKRHIIEGRNMTPEELEPYTDARIFTGETAVTAGFADSIGTYTDALALVGKMSGLGQDPQIFTPEPSYLDIFSNKLGSVLKTKSSIGASIADFFAVATFSLRGQPLYIFPPAIGL